MLGRWCCVASLVLLGVAGCGGSESPAGGGASKAPVLEGPAGAVHEFLHAVKTGDEKKAADMLTDKARTKTAEMDLEVAPPGSDTASFEVGEVEMLDDNAAYVGSVWSDVDPDGTKRSDQIVWVLRKEPEGWRIAGMVTRLLDSKLILNFEDPEDMIAKQEAAAKALEEYQKNTPYNPESTEAPPLQAEKPKNSTLR
jgi:hypothetical protein